MMRYIAGIILLLQATAMQAAPLDAPALFDNLRKKVLTVKDYTAKVKMKINVSYMRIPPLAGMLYYKSPDKMRLERNGGLSILPKKNINMTLRNLIPSGNVMVFDAGVATIEGKSVRILKVVPEDDNSEIVLAKIWVDEAGLLALRTETTTRNEGTIIMDLRYDRFAIYALPDKVTIFMDLKGYKLPKGVTMDYNDTEKPLPPKDKKNEKGTIQITYLSYDINKGIDDKVFKERE